MTTQQPDWHAYLAQMETVLGVTLDDARRAELQVQFSHVPAWPLVMALPLDDRLEIAGVYKHPDATRDEYQHNPAGAECGRAERP